MELKTKYNIGDEVYYIEYIYVGYDVCPKCGREINTRHVFAVNSGTIRRISITIDSLTYKEGEQGYTEIEYHISDDDDPWGVEPALEEDVFYTEEEALEAAEKAKKEKEDDA